MRFLQVSTILFQFILLHVDASSLSDVEKFLHGDYETDITGMCTRLAESRNAFRIDLDNYNKLQTYINDMAEAHARQNSLATKLGHFRKPFIFDDEYFREEYELALQKVDFENERIMRLTGEAYAILGRAFNMARVCPYHNQTCEFPTEALSISEIEDVMAQSRDYDELLYMWKAWRKANADLKDIFEFYYKTDRAVNTSSNSTEDNEYLGSDGVTLEHTLRLWQEVEPLYIELHKYVSRKLKQFYGDKLNISDGFLPAHILGNMWAESWYQIEPLVRPFPNVSDGNLEDNLKELFTVIDIFRAADEFFQSLGLASMKTAYDQSDGMLTKPTDGREVACQPASSDYCIGSFRVTVCGKLDLEHFIDIHHEMGHLQYFYQYKDLPYFRRESASSALRETIGESVALSATSPRHLKRLGLLTDYRDTYESSINYLMKIALIKIAFLPFGLIVDMWKSDVVLKKVPNNQWNARWWEYRMKYQKIKPPVPRSDATDFDPLAHFHVAVNEEYITYFHAHFMEFQIYKHLCLETEEFNPDLHKICPLHDCDFYEYKEVGNILRDALRLGNMKHWEVVLKMLAGTPNITSEAILEYFQPLYEFLKKENEKAEDEKHVPHVPHVLEHAGHPAVIVFVCILILAAIFGAIYLKYLRAGRFRIFLQ